MTEPANITVSANCPCGTRLSWPEDIADDDMILCKGCGSEVGPYRDFKAKMRERAIAAGREAILDAFKRGGRKF